MLLRNHYFFFFSSRRRHTRCSRDWSSDVCSSDLTVASVRECPNLRLDREAVTRRFASPYKETAMRPRFALFATLAVATTAWAQAPRPTPSSRRRDRKSTRLNSSHGYISYAVFCLEKKKQHMAL